MLYIVYLQVGTVVFKLSSSRTVNNNSNTSTSGSVKILLLTVIIVSFVMSLCKRRFCFYLPVFLIDQLYLCAVDTKKLP